MDLSFTEIVVVCCIALLLFGPEEFVRRTRQFSLWLASMRGVASNLRTMLDSELRSKEVKAPSAEVANLDHESKNPSDEPPSSDI